MTSHVGDRAPVDGLRRFVDEFDVERLRVDLPDAVTLAVAREPVDEDRDVRFHVSADQREFVVRADMEWLSLPAFAGPGCFFLRGCFFVHGGQFFEESLSQIPLRLFRLHPREQRAAADQQMIRRIVVPANRPHLEEHFAPRGQRRPVGQLHIAGYIVFACRDADDLLGAEPVDRQAFEAVRTRDRKGQVGQRQRAVFVFLLRHVPQSGSEDRHRIRAELRRGDARRLADTLQQGRLTRPELQHRPHRADTGRLLSAASVHAHAVRQIPADVAVVQRKAVIRYGQKREVCCRRGLRRRAEQRQRALEYLFM